MFVSCICHSGCFKHISLLPEGPRGVNLPVWLCDWAVEEAHWTWHSCHSGWTDAQLHFLRSWQLQWLKNIIHLSILWHSLSAQFAWLKVSLSLFFFSNLPFVQSDLFFFPCLSVYQSPPMSVWSLWVSVMQRVLCTTASQAHLSCLAAVCFACPRTSRTFQTR